MTKLLYRDTVTLFNRRREGGRCVWLPTLLEGVGLYAANASSQGRYGAQTDDRVVLHVGMSYAEGGRRVVAGKLWLPPELWRSQPEGPAKETVTFGSGADFDFFVSGEYEGGSFDDGDYDRDGGFYGYLNRTRSGVYAITSVSGPFSLIPHFEIIGR